MTIIRINVWERSGGNEPSHQVSVLIRAFVLFLLIGQWLVHSFKAQIEKKDKERISVV